jgi:hypothetical protein
MIHPLGITLAFGDVPFGFFSAPPWPKGEAERE